jgi:dGTPase
VTAEPKGPAFPDDAHRAHREQLEQLEEERLAPYALKSSRSSRRVPMDAEGRVFDYRTEYQRDRDRIIHSRSFRRLRDKSRTHLSEDGDHHHSRMTHALEVSQLARTMAQALRLNQDLVEAIALGHDLGWPPLGSGGIQALDTILSGGLPVDGLTAGALHALGGFDVPGQSLKVVDLLEKRYDHPGINLTDDCRAGIWKQQDPMGDRLPPEVPEEGLDAGAPPSAEAQVVAVCCRIAGRTQELDDLLRGTPELLERFERLDLLRELKRKLGGRYQRARSRFMRLNVIHRGLTHLLVTDAIRQSEASLASWARREKIDTTERYHQRRGALPPAAVGPSETVAALLGDLEALLDSKLAGSRAVMRSRHRALMVLGDLFRAYYTDPAVVDDYLLLRFREAKNLRYLRDVPAAEREQEVARRYRGSVTWVRMLCDHLAGMTDGYALSEHRQLCAS